MTTILSASALTASPYALAYIRAAQERDLPPNVAVTPACSFALACEAICTLDPSRVDTDEALSELRDSTQQREAVEYTTELAAVAATSWWTAPLDTSAQGWFSRTDSPPAAARFRGVHGEPTAWERYAQKPESCLWTSTLREGTTAAVAAVQAKAGDLGAAGPVASLWSLAMAAVRVYVVRSAADWHTLCRQHPERREDGRLVPAWNRVGRAWDAVHLTFAGVMTATGVRVESDMGWTTLAGWDVEQTVWLRWHVRQSIRVQVPSPPRCWRRHGARR